MPQTAFPLSLASPTATRCIAPRHARAAALNCTRLTTRARGVPPEARTSASQDNGRNVAHDATKMDWLILLCLSTLAVAAAAATAAGVLRRPLRGLTTVAAGERRATDAVSPRRRLADVRPSEAVVHRRARGGRRFADTSQDLLPTPASSPTRMLQLGLSLRHALAAKGPHRWTITTQ